MTKLGLIYLKFICTWFSFIFTTPTGFLFTNASETKMPGPGEGGGVLGLIFIGYVPLASQSPYPIVVYSVANY